VSKSEEASGTEPPGPGAPNSQTPDSEVADSETPDSEATEHRHTYYKNPWVLAFIAGVITLSLIGPCTRHIPDAPPALASVPIFAFPDSSGQPFGSNQLSAGPYILGFVSAVCHLPECVALNRGLERIRSQYKVGEVEIPVIGVIVDDGRPADPGARPPLDDVKTLTATKADAQPLMAALATIGKVTVKNPWDLGIVLVDSQGRCRGLYATDDDGVDEALHRAIHVLRDELAGK
jgi:protein SCO1/2